MADADQDLLTHRVWRLVAQGEDLPDLEELLGRPAWHAHAACRGLGTRTFFPRRGNSLAAAKRVCAGCTVRDLCLEAAVEGSIEHGIWGGRSAAERSPVVAPAPLHSS